MKKLDIIGRVFGLCKVFAEAPPTKDSTGNWRRQSWVRCGCGKEFIARNGNLLSGNTTSCGCFHKPLGYLRKCKHGHTVHGLKSRTYTAWQNMLQRCLNTKNSGFVRYGERGIAICARWRHSFTAFLEDMGECPPKLEIERVNNLGNYEPGNCVWGTQHQQDRNRRDNRVLTVHDFTGCFVDVSAHFQINPHTAFERIQRGWSLERAFTQPVDKRFRKAKLTDKDKERSVEPD